MDLRPGTRAAHAGLPEAAQGQPFLPGPELAGPYHLAGDPHSTPYGYGRYANRTIHNYERALGELEGGEAVVFASGMAACSAVLLALVEAGDPVALPADGYPVVRKLATQRFDARLFPASAPDAGEAKLLWLESPSNPGLDVCDIRAVAAAARERGVLVVVDNSLVTPLGQRPLDLGADVSVASGTKALSGHSDLLIGYAACADPAVAARIREWRDMTGGIAGPFEAWLAHRSLATLDIRLERQCANALAIARALAARDVPVRYPGLEDDPAHAIAKGQMRHFGPVVSFDLGGEDRAQSFLEAAALVAETTSFGGIHTTAERRARWGQGDDVAPGFIRLSAGIEDEADLVADIEAALAAAAPG